MVLICQWLGANMAVFKAVLAIFSFLLSTTLVSSCVFLTVYADVVRCISAALLLNVVCARLSREHGAQTDESFSS